MKKKDKIDEGKLTSPNENLAQKIVDCIQYQGFILPSKSDIALLLSDDKMMKIFSFCINAIDEYKNNKTIKSKVQIYRMYQDKISKLKQLNDQRNKMLLELQNKKEELEKIKEKRKKIIIQNKNMLQVLKDQQKRKLLSDIKYKVILSSMTPMNDLLCSISKHSYIENFKYDHGYFGKQSHLKEMSAIDEDDEEQFDIMKYLNNTSSQLSLFNQSMSLQSSQMSKISKENKTANNKSTSHIVPLPKLSNEELKKYTPLTQNKFHCDIMGILNSLTFNTKGEKENSLSMSMDSISSSKDKKDDRVKYEFDNINKKFNDIVQKGEKQLTFKYQEAKEINIYKNITEENNKLIQSNQIDKSAYEKICQIVRNQLGQYLISQYREENKDVELIDEFILPKSVISMDSKERLCYYIEVLDAYKKIKNRTDSFIRKRLLPLSLLLDEKYTDFINSINTEYDYFIKLTLNHIKTNQERSINIPKYSLSQFRYDKVILSSMGINNKYDIFSYYLRYINKEIENEAQREEIKRLTDALYNNGKYQDYSKQSSSINEANKFITSYNFEQKYKLFPDKDKINQINKLINEFFDVKYASSCVFNK